MSSLLALWKRYPSIGVLAALSVMLIPASLVWTTARVYVPVITGEMWFVTDFSFYYEAAERFLRDPLSLYPDPFGFMYPPPSVVLFLPLLSWTNLEIGKGDWVIVNPKRFKEMLLEFDSKRLLARYDEFVEYVNEDPKASRRRDDGRRPLRGPGGGRRGAQARRGGCGLPVR